MQSERVKSNKKNIHVIENKLFPLFIMEKWEKEKIEQQQQQLH